MQFIIENWKEISAILAAIWDLVGRAVPSKKPLAPTAILTEGGTKIFGWLSGLSKKLDNRT